MNGGQEVFQPLMFDLHSETQVQSSRLGGGHSFSIDFHQESSLPCLIDVLWNIEEVKLSLKRTGEPTIDHSNHVIRFDSKKGYAGDMAHLQPLLEANNIAVMPNHLDMKSIRLICIGRRNGPEGTMDAIVKLREVHAPDVFVLVNVAFGFEECRDFFSGLGYGCSSVVGGGSVDQGSAAWMVWNPSNVSVEVTNASFPAIKATISKVDYPEFVSSVLKWWL